MVQLSLDTHNEGWDWCSGYYYSDSSIMGFSHTHLSGNGRGELFAILLMPMGKIHIEPGSRVNPDESRQILEGGLLEFHIANKPGKAFKMNYHFSFVA